MILTQMSVSKQYSQGREKGSSVYGKTSILGPHFVGDTKDRTSPREKSRTICVTELMLIHTATTTEAITYYTGI